MKKDPMILNRSYLGSQIPSLSMKSISNYISVYNWFLQCNTSQQGLIGKCYKISYIGTHGYGPESLSMKHFIFQVKSPNNMNAFCL
jgi:hypothetical protein